MASTAVIRNLQNYLFEPNEERIITCCHVSKNLKKKKTSFLCLVYSGVPYNISIVQVKQTDRQVFKKKRNWSLVELKSVDGHNESPENLEFDLHLDKVYRWVALGHKERHAFIHNLWKHASRHILKDKPIFKNVPKSWVTEDALTSENSFVASPFSPLETEFTEDFQAITDKEQDDLKQLISGCEFAISNAEGFMDVLARDLSLLDGENVQCVLASEEQVESLMNQLELAINEADRLENQLNSYDEILCHVRDTMEKMEKKNSVISIANSNNQLLMQNLEDIIRKLDLPAEHHRTFEDADFTSTEGLLTAIKAANALKEAMNADINEAFLRMAAIQEQKKRFEKYKEKFSRSLSRQLNNLFIHYGNHKGESDRTVEGLILPQHSGVHKELYIYTELIHWMKAMDRKMFESLKEVYITSLAKLYDRDLRGLFNAAREKLSPAIPLSPPIALIGLERDQWTLDVASHDRKKFDTVLEQVLTQLEPVFLQEQQFCMKFFQLDVLSPSAKDSETSIKIEYDLVSQRKVEKQIDEEIRNMMSSLFACLKTELDLLIDCIKKQDSFYCMYVLVRLNQHVMSAQSTFLSNTFASQLIEVKRSLDQFMQQQIDSIKECRIPRKSKCGILPYVSNLEVFTTNADCLLKSDRRADLEKWYTRLADTMIDYISIHSNDQKTPSQVIKMENYHHLYSLFSQLKIGVLDSQRREAKQKYSDALQAYVTLHFGRPLEKLNTFFEGVQAKVASGVKMSEVSYQLAFSKQELRKVINQYPGSTVKKGLEALYRKVEKHLSEESNLLQVVWRAMQEEFITQYKMLEDLIQQCYPGSMISLEFTIEDILQFFSDIARSH